MTAIQKVDSLLINSANRNCNQVIHSVIEKELDHTVESSGLSIKIATQGIETYVVDGKVIDVPAGYFTIVQEGRRVNFFSESPKEIIGTCIYLESDLIQEVWANHTWTLDQQLANPFHLPKAPELLDGRLYALEEFPSYQALLHQSRLQHIDETFFINGAEQVLNIQEESLNAIKNISAAKDKTKKELFQRLQTVYHFILENYREEITIDQLSRVAFLSKFHLIRTFSQVYGKSPIKLLHHLRMAHAEALMANQSNPDLQQIAADVGFNSKRSLVRFMRLRD